VTRASGADRPRPSRVCEEPMEQGRRCPPRGPGRWRGPRRRGGAGPAIATTPSPPAPELQGLGHPLADPAVGQRVVPPVDRGRPSGARIPTASRRRRPSGPGTRRPIPPARRARRQRCRLPPGGRRRGCPLAGRQRVEGDVEMAFEDRRSRLGTRQARRRQGAAAVRDRHRRRRGAAPDRLPVGVSAPRWFPDSKRIAFIARVLADAPDWDEMKKRLEERENRR
jgi:hypothetical protein